MRVALLQMVRWIFMFFLRFGSWFIQYADVDENTCLSDGKCLILRICNINEIMNKEVLLGKSVAELREVALSVGLPAFAGKQLADWLYKKRVCSIDEMTNLSKKGREALASRYVVGRVSPTHVAESVDGTKKYLFPVSCGEKVEAVYIPSGDRATLCISTQAGCKMHCKFCMTGGLGFHGQLTVSDMVNQVFSVPESESLTNIVVMGMGEPMDNVSNLLGALSVMTSDWGCAWSPRRITVSTVGLLPGLERFLRESECHLAVSLHNPFSRERESIMPVEKAYKLKEVLDLLKQFDFAHQRRVSFEYIVFAGVNDSVRHAVELQKVLRGLPCRINLIRFHDTDQCELKGANDERIAFLRDYLNDNGITTTIRQSRGEDILAACGMLIAKEGNVE